MEKISTTTASNRTKILRLALLALLLSLVIMLIFKKPPYINIENDQLHIMLENNIPIYDIRRPDEWKQTGVVASSQLLTFVDKNGQVKPDFFNRFTAETNKQDPVILICRTGNRTAALATHLVKKLGYTNVFNVDDGITRWIREGRPVQRALTSKSETYHSKDMQ